jgi:hypothetical protein
VRTHRTCIFAYARRADGPAMSVVYYVPTDSDELLISTMRGRAKSKATQRLGKASLRILDERWPFAYLQVYCDARVDDDLRLVVDVMMAVAGRMSGTPLGEEARPAVAAMAKDEGRVVLRCRPTRPLPHRRATSTATIRRRRSRTGSPRACRGTHPTHARRARPGSNVARGQPLHRQQIQVPGGETKTPHPG